MKLLLNRFSIYEKSVILNCSTTEFSVFQLALNIVNDNTELKEDDIVGELSFFTDNENKAHLVNNEFTLLSNVVKDSYSVSPLPIATGNYSKFPLIEMYPDLLFNMSSDYGLVLPGHVEGIKTTREYLNPTILPIEHAIVATDIGHPELVTPLITMLHLRTDKDITEEDLDSSLLIVNYNLNLNVDCWGLFEHAGSLHLAGIDDNLNLSTDKAMAYGQQPYSKREQILKQTTTMKVMWNKFVQYNEKVDNEPNVVICAQHFTQYPAIEERELLRYHYITGEVIDNPFGLNDNLIEIIVNASRADEIETLTEKLRAEFL